MRSALALLAVLILFGGVSSPGRSRAETQPELAVSEPQGQVVYDVYAPRREWHWLEVSGLDGTNPHTITASEGKGSRAIGGVTWSPDGTRITFLQSRGDTRGGSTYLGVKTSLWVVNADGSGLHQVARWSELGPGIRPAVWSPDGTKLAFAQSRVPYSQPRRSDLALYAVNADGTGLRKLRAAVPATWPRRGVNTVFVDPIAWTPDSSRIVYLWSVFEGGDYFYRDWSYGEFYSISTDGRERQRIARVDDKPVRDPIMSADGQRIAYLGSADDVAYMLDVGSGSTRPIVDYSHDGDLDVIERLAWFPNSTELAFQRYVNTNDDDDDPPQPTTIRVVDVTTGEIATVAATAAYVVCCLLTIGFDGTSLAYVTEDTDGQRTIVVVGRDGAELGSYQLRPTHVPPEGVDIEPIRLD